MRWDQVETELDVKNEWAREWLRVSSSDVKGGCMGNVTESTHSTILDSGIASAVLLKLL